MEDLISKGALFNALAQAQDKGEIFAIIQDMPTVDAEPVRHGHWKITKDGAAWCSACKRKMNPCQYGYPRCAMCGAKMDEVSADAT